MSPHRALLLAAFATSALAFVLLIVPPRARASCAAPTTCTRIHARVTACAVVVPASVASIARMTTALEHGGERDTARAIRNGYRGAVFDVEPLATSQVSCRTSRGSAQSAAQIRMESNRRSFFVASTAADPCARFAIGTVLDVAVAEPCCDGDPGAPCLIRGMDADAVRHGTTAP